MQKVPEEPETPELETRVQTAMRSDRLSKERKLEISKMWGFARMLDAAVLLALEDEGF